MMTRLRNRLSRPMAAHGHDRVRRRPDRLFADLGPVPLARLGANRWSRPQVRFTSNSGRIVDIFSCCRTIKQGGFAAACRMERLEARCGTALRATDHGATVKTRARAPRGGLPRAASVADPRDGTSRRVIYGHRRRPDATGPACHEVADVLCRTKFFWGKNCRSTRAHVRVLWRARVRCVLTSRMRRARNWAQRHARRTLKENVVLAVLWARRTGWPHTPARKLKRSAPWDSYF